MDATALLQEYLPHAPQHGLYRAPDIPRPKLGAAIDDYGKAAVVRDDVLALYDATRLGSAKDGALFCADRLVYQNNNLSSPRTVHYDDIVRVEAKKLFLGGRRLELDVNEARATVTERLDFSAHAEAAAFVERFLREVVLLSTDPDRSAPSAATPEADGASPDVGGVTDVGVVEESLEDLVQAGLLAGQDRDRMMEVLRSAHRAG